MNKEDKRKKLFSSGGIFVDIFIGFLIAACIAGVVYRCFIYDPHMGADEGSSYMVYFEVLDAHQSYVKYLENGDVVYDTLSGLPIGELQEHEQHAEGCAVLVTHNEQDDQNPLTVRGVFRSVAGYYEEGTLELDGTYTLTPGQVLGIYTDTVEVQVRILKITAEPIDHSAP